MSAWAAPAKKTLFSLVVLLGIAIPIARSESHQEQAQVPPAPAMPESILFYPEMAEATVVELVAPTTVGSRRGLVLHLPRKAARDGFAVTVAGEPSGPGIWYTGLDPDNDDDDAALAVDPEDEPCQERRVLLQTLLEARHEKARLEGELATVKSRLNVWEARRSPKEDGDKPDDLEKLDSLLAQRLPKLHASQEELGRVIEVQRRRINKAEKALADHDKEHRDLKVLLPVDESVNEPVEVRYTYAVPASMSPKYRILAEPAKKQVVIVEEVTLKQHSGMDWKDVRMSVSTLRRQRLLAPHFPAHWPISYHTHYQPEAYSMREMMMDDTPVATAQSCNIGGVGDARHMTKVAPVAEDRSTFRLWDLGKRSLEDGRSTDVQVLKNTHDATFFYLLRPATDRMGFLVAEVAAKEPQELPPGQARFFVDGVLVGEAPFAFNGVKGRLFLGQDPRVIATMRDLKREAGTQGFLSKENTVAWHWEIEVRNSRGHAVDIQVEDPAPNPDADVFTVKLESKPVPESVLTDPLQGGRKVYRWPMKLQPGESSLIDHKVMVSGPANKRFEPGRGTR